MEIFILLILETENDIHRNIFYSSESLEDFLKTINLDDYLRKNIILYIDDEMCFELSKVYNKRYLKICG